MEDSKHFGEPRLRQSSPVLAASNEMESAAGNGTQVDLPKAFATKPTEERDPLRDDQILLQGLRIAEPGDDGANTIRKVPSDQTVSMFRWGYVHLESSLLWCINLPPQSSLRIN